MRGLILAVVAAVVLLVAAGSAEAHGPFVARGTPFNPFRGPVIVNRGFNGGFNNFNGSRGFSYGGARGFNGHGGARTIVVDQFGNIIAIR
jgi:hypothetical protein